jgi:predicted nucleic acid-binding protein
LTRLVIDANVAIKWFVPEVQSDAAAAIVDPENELIAPDLLLVEVGNVVWKKIRSGDITDEEGKNIMTSLEAMPINFHSIRPLLPSALDLACRAGCTVYDATYIALALAQDCTLVSADRRLFLKFESSAIGRRIQLI